MRSPRNRRPATSLDYVERVNRAIDHVTRNLDRPLPLEDVARAACFSPFHFHRVFGAVTGEPLAQFVKRLRLERAVFLMSHAPRRSLTEVALACGFSSSSDFSRSFRQHYGVAPRAFRLDEWRSRRRETLEDTVTSTGGPRLRRLATGENPDGFAVRMRDVPPRTVAYIRVADPYRGGVAEAAQRLVAWAEARGVADRQWLGYQWEDPEIVALEKCRYDVAVEVDRVQPRGEVGRYDFPAMRVAEVEIRGGLDLGQRALDWLFGTWLPASGFEPDDQPCFEAWIGRPFAHGTERFEVRAQLPVVRSR